MIARSSGARSYCKNVVKVTLTFATLQQNRGSLAQTQKNSMVFVHFCLGPGHDCQATSDAQMSAVETRQMSSVETGQMSATETGQMSAVETRQMSSAETRQMKSIQAGQRLVAIVDICLVSAEDNCLVSTADICPISTADICAVSTEGMCSLSKADIKAWLAEAATAADKSNDNHSLAFGGRDSGRLTKFPWWRG